MRMLIAVLAMLVMGCGGSEGDGPGPGTGGTGGGTDELCATYHPDPHTDPTYSRTDCVPEDWPRSGFCWRTADTPDCLREGVVAVGCVFVRESDSGAKPGTQTNGCRLDLDCIPSAIDNPTCCGDHPERGEGWDCATP